MSKIQMTLACWHYDRTRSLMEGSTGVEGVELNYLDLPVEETFFRMLRNREFDAAEMSLSSYVLSLFQEEPPFIAIPVFPSRFFRHSCIFVNRHSGIQAPFDLRGKRVGTPEYQMTAGVWIRGILADQYSVPVESVTYVTGGLEQAGRHEKLKLSLPMKIQVKACPNEKNLSQMLDLGEVDALYTARWPSSFNDSKGNVRQLFANYSGVEKDYFRDTRIFPIMHTIVLRRNFYRQNPWVARSLYKAFEMAKNKAMEDLSQTAALMVSLPWLSQHFEDTRIALGNDFWPYGVEANQNTLKTFLRYSFEQGLAKRLLQPEDIFAPECLEDYRI